MGAAILDRKSWGPPSWTGSDVKNAKVAPILLLVIIYYLLSSAGVFQDHFLSVKFIQECYQSVIKFRCR